MGILMNRKLLGILAVAIAMLAARAAAEPPADILLPPLPGQQRVAAVAPAGGILGFQRGFSGNLTPLSTLARVHGMRINHLIGHGLVVGLQNTGDTQQTLFSIQFLLNTLRHESVTLPSSLNPSNIQTRNLAAAMVTADMPPFARVGARIDSLVSALGDSRSLQGGTLMMTPLRGADGRVYALAQGPLTIEGYFAGASGGAAARKNFQTAGQIPGGATVEREVESDFSQSRVVQIDLNDPDPTVATRAAAAISAQYQEAQVVVVDPGTVRVQLPPWLSAVSFAAALDQVAVEAGDSDRVVMDERTGTIVVGGQVTVGKAAISHGNLTVTIEPKLTVSQPGAFSGGTTVTQKSAKITVDQEQGQFFMVPQGANVEQIAETLNAVGTKPGDVIAIFEGLRAAGALRGQLVVR